MEFVRDLKRNERDFNEQFGPYYFRVFWVVQYRTFERPEMMKMMQWFREQGISCIPPQRVGSTQ